MSGKYNECCMKFNNDELKKYMIDYLVKNSWNKELIRCFSEEGDEAETVIQAFKRLDVKVSKLVEEFFLVTYFGL